MKKMPFKAALTCCVALSTLWSGSPASAQTSSADGAAPSGRDDVAADDQRLSEEEIVVTAQKRNERLAETPLSVSVVSAGDLARLGATQFRDFANTIPGLSFTTNRPGNTQINLRGVTSGTDLSSAVAVYVDEVPYGSSTSFASGAQSALDVALFDLDQIEILRGPQGTLYGAASMGGIVKYVTRRPSFDGADGEGRLGFSFTDDGGLNYDVAAAANVPLANRAGLRVSLFESHDAGFVDNIALGDHNVNKSDIHGGRADLLIEPTDSLSIRLTAFGQNIRSDGQASVDVRTGAITSPPSDLTQRRLYREPFNQDFRLLSGVVTYDFGPAVLTSVTSYQTLNSREFVDSSPQLLAFLTAAPPGGLGRSYSAIGSLQRLELDKFSQEVRLASDNSGTIQWLVGGVYTREDAEKAQVYDPRDLTGAPANNDILNLLITSKYEDIAAFGDLTFRLTDRFDVTGGLRYARNDQTVTQVGSGLFGGSRPARSANEEVATYLLNARFRFTDRTMMYARFATGYRPGGPNIVLNNPTTGQPLAPPTFDADTLRSYELGFKAETADGVLTIDAAGYYIDWDNIQIAAIRNGVGVRANAPGGARVRGGEISAVLRPTSGLRLTGAFSYIDAELASAAPDLGGQKGDSLPNVPDLTASLSADYRLATSRWNPSLGFTVRYVSDRRQNFGAAAYTLPEYASVDLRGSFDVGPATAQLFVRNLFNSKGQFSEFTLGNQQRVSIQQPRTIGVSTSLQF